LDDPADEAVMDIAHGDPAMARQLRLSLELLRDRTDNDEFRRLVDDVLTGRADLRDVYSTPAFAAGINPGVEQFAERYDQLTPEQRDEMAEQGRQALARERNRLAQED
jgi:hypothetical protein